MHLSKNFTLAEMTRSYVAQRAHPRIDNSLNPDDIDKANSAVANLKKLCTEVLQPLRDHFGTPTLVSSGYRCEALNRAVNGSAKSYHMSGLAADIEQVGVSNLELAHYIRDNLPFEQLILEYWDPDIPNSGWVHVAANFKGSEQRGEVLTKSHNIYMRKLPDLEGNM